MLCYEDTLWQAHPSTSRPCAGDPPVPRPSGSSASPGFSSSTMGSECSLRVSLPGTEGELVPAPVSPCLEAAGGQVPAPLEQLGREVTAPVAPGGHGVGRGAAGGSAGWLGDWPCTSHPQPLPQPLGIGEPLQGLPAPHNPPPPTVGRETAVRRGGAARQRRGIDPHNQWEPRASFQAAADQRHGDPRGCCRHGRRSW